MKFFCFERDNQTQFTSPGSTRETYMASFELFPFYEGSAFSLYKGLLNGKGPLRGEFCVVRTKMEKAVDPMVWRAYLMRAAEASSLASRFNLQIGLKVISFLAPMLTKIDTVSDFSCLFKCFVPHDKHLHLEEYVVLEPYIEGKFRYNFNFDLQKLYEDCSDLLSEEGDTDMRTKEKALRASKFAQWPNLSEAFSHFTWHATRSLVICGLHGVFKDMVYTLTNPTIHSLSLQYGETDRGAAAIAEFFVNHQCNNVCCEWEAYSPGHPLSQNIVPFNDIACQSEQVAPLRCNTNPRRHSAAFTPSNKIASKQLNRISYPAHPDLLRIPDIAPTLNNQSDQHVNSRKIWWQNISPSNQQEEEINTTYVCNKLVFPVKFSNQTSHERLLPSKFHSQILLSSKQELVTPFQFRSYHNLPVQPNCITFYTNRENEPIRELGDDGQTTDSKDNKMFTPEEQPVVEAAQEQLNPVSSEHTSKDQGSYYSCNPAEPSRLLRKDNGFQISLV
ncbi:alpha-protein kinase vwkA [Biomphalaria pfeifferi]|uniref:Alpha-protein kinase vwkA n=1 Tax=Biomphalaria pfeifferi TaxID=112525 RepID=A0AAD8BXM5_BIOPF|nr:alpha-protein kinase vwkA [Biomphalaria pfeifferi]